MFETLTIDELRSLMAALMTRHGYSSNKMTLVLAGMGGPIEQTYIDIATEQGKLFLEVSEALTAKYGVAA